MAYESKYIVGHDQRRFLASKCMMDAFSHMSWRRKTMGDTGGRLSRRELRIAARNTHVYA